MNPVVLSIIGSLVRMALGGVVAWLIHQGIMQPDQTVAFYSGVTTCVAAIAWAIYHNVHTGRVMNTAAAMPPTTIAAAQEAVKRGDFVPASTPTTTQVKITF